MAECSDLQSLEKITSEVDNSHVKIILSSQCIKAQIFLVDRLRKETGRQKEVCKYISSGNLKLEAEIKHAEQEFKSLLIANDTIKTSNIEIRKELLLAKEKKEETIDRVETGIKKYEKLWLQCKSRYESIPFVQKWFELTNKTQSLNDRIKFLDQEIETLIQEIKKKRRVMKELDQKRVVEIANYLMRERPKIIHDIKNKKAHLNALTNEMAEHENDQEVKRSEIELKLLNVDKIPNNTLLESDWPSLSQNFCIQQETLKMPKLQLAKGELDILAVNLEQIKKTAVTPKKTLLHTEYTSPKTDTKKDDYYISAFFNKSYLPSSETETNMTTESGSENYAKKKLINILEDINIDQNDAKDLIYSINPRTMKEVNIIGVNINAPTPNIDDTKIADNKLVKYNENKEEDSIEEIDLTASNNILIPPTQFLDLSQEKTAQEIQECQELSKDGGILSQQKNSQDSLKKKVSFDLPVIQEVPENIVEIDKATNNEFDLTINSQVDMDTSGMSNESFTKMKERILKKYSLDLSPDFVYEKKIPENAVTSKFFNNNRSNIENINISNANEKDEKMAPLEKVEIMDEDKEQKPTNNNIKSTNHHDVIDQTPVLVDDEIMDTCSKNAENPKGKSVSGFLFTHGPHGIPDSLDVSISTTGFEEGDGDFPHCIDASLLLSPKADMPVPSSADNGEPFSQEVPNFLAGLRKTGFSFFGKPSGSDSNAESNATAPGNNFNFNFGGNEKKSRGGLFSMFR